MSGLKLTIEGNSPEVTAQFRAFVREKMADRSTPNKAWSVQLFADMMRNFEDEGGLFESGGWAPMADSTSAEKQRLGYSPKLMLRTGFLRDTAWFNSDEDGVAVGFLAEYASYHDDTDDKYSPGEKLPRRRLLPPMDYAMERGTEVWEWYIKKSIQEVNL